MHSKNERQHGSTPKNKQINNNLHSVLKKKKKENPKANISFNKIDLIICSSLSLILS